MRYVYIVLVLILVSSVLAETIDYKQGTTNQILSFEEGEQKTLLISNNTKIIATAINSGNLTVNSIQKINFSSLPQTTWNSSMIYSFVFESFILDFSQNENVELKLQSDLMQFDTSKVLIPTIMWYAQFSDAWVKISPSADNGRIIPQSHFYTLAGYSPIVNVVKYDTSVSCPQTQVSCPEVNPNITMSSPEVSFPSSIMCSGLSEEVKSDLIARITNAQGDKLSSQLNEIKDKLIANQNEEINSNNITIDYFNKLLNQIQSKEEKPPFSDNQIGLIVFSGIFLIAIIGLLLVRKMFIHKKKEEEWGDDYLED